VKVKDADGVAVRLATFHAPFLINKEKKEYKNQIPMEYLDAFFKTGAIYCRPLAKGEVVPDESKLIEEIDVLLADVNIYDNQDCASVAKTYKEWICALNSVTTKGNAALDRVFVRSGKFAKFRCGRIYVKGNAPGALSGLDKPRRGNTFQYSVIDIEVPDGDSSKEWHKSDHGAIYFDTDETKDKLPDFDSSSLSTSSKKRDDEELFELGGDGKPKRQNDGKDGKKELNNQEEDRDEEDAMKVGE
jgi:hypothetical protein